MENGSDSIFEIYRKTKGYIETKRFYIYLPWIIGLLLGIISFIFPLQMSDIQNIILTMLTFNGSVLGFTIAGFGISQFFSSKEVLIFMVKEKADNYPWSYYKTYLLIFLHVLVAIFGGIIFLSFMYFVTFFSQYLSGKVPDFLFITLLKSLFILLIVSCQAIIFIKIKIFIFFIYENYLMLGQAIATNDSVTPYDKSNC